MCKTYVNAKSARENAGMQIKTNPTVYIITATFGEEMEPWAVPCSLIHGVEPKLSLAGNKGSNKEGWNREATTLCTIHIQAHMG